MHMAVLGETTVIELYSQGDMVYPPFSRYYLYCDVFVVLCCVVLCCVVLCCVVLCGVVGCGVVISIMSC